eukprot:6208961-Pleurochrysis_carterae.AAC.4
MGARAAPGSGAAGRAGACALGRAGSSDGPSRRVGGRLAAARLRARRCALERRLLLPSRCRVGQSRPQRQKRERARRMHTRGGRAVYAREA